MANKIFTQSEKRIISAMYQLNRWATVNEIAEWAEDMSWNTASSVLLNLRRKKIIESKIIDRKLQWRMVEDEE